MARNSIFSYKAYHWEVIDSDLVCEFGFNANDQYFFTPKLIFRSIELGRVDKLKDKIDNLVFNIGLIELFSYWKAFVTPQIVVECRGLDNYQISWWQDLIIKGMGQFFYENNIDFTKEHFVEFSSTQKPSNKKLLASVSSESVLIPVGGGKDSSVTLELLTRNFQNASAFLVNPSPAEKRVANLAEVEAVVVERKLDKKLFDLNKKGFPNGHTPFTALLSFISILSAVLGSYKTVAFSNEKSSDEENTTFLGHKINHQYSKTLEFENKFRDYNSRYLSTVNYFSFLRPIYDIQIAKIFSKFDKYHLAIRSCNMGQKTDSWCGTCPKCLSTFMLFKPFLKDKTSNIFGKDLLHDPSLQPLVNALTSELEVKPFECVGTREELRVALGIEKSQDILTSWDPNNNLPDKYAKILKKYI